MIEPYQRDNLLVAPSQARGLKLEQQAGWDIDGTVAPSQARGLKPMKMGRAAIRTVSRLHRRVD